MLSCFKPALAILLFASVFAAPLDKRLATDTSSYCGQWDSVSAGPYSLCLDKWGVNTASLSLGSSCASILSLRGTTISWKTAWNWVGGGIKSYTNIQLNDGLNKQLSNIQSIPARWQWSQNPSGSIVADVAYDLFTSDTPGGQNVNEIMIWLANFNSGPIAVVYSANGTAQSIANSIPLAGHNWDLYFGSNGANNVYSFLPSGGAIIKKFHGDLNVFLNYLTSNENVSTSQFLKTAQGGTEVVSGSATFTTSKYSLAIN